VIEGARAGGSLVTLLLCLTTLHAVCWFRWSYWSCLMKKLTRSLPPRVVEVLFNWQNHRFWLVGQVWTFSRNEAYTLPEFSVANWIPALRLPAT